MADSAPSVDKEENEFFTKVSSVWWTERQHRLHACSTMISDHIAKILKESANDRPLSDIHILDVGCGGGFVSEPLAKAGFRVTGIDVNENLIAVAKEHANLDSTLTNLSYHWQSLEDHVLTNTNKYDVVILTFVLQHALHHDLILSNCVKAIKPKGLIFLSAASKTFKSWFDIIFCRQILKGVFVGGTHRWRNFINCADVERILSENGCIVKHVTGLSCNFLFIDGSLLPTPMYFTSYMPLKLNLYSHLFLQGPSI